MIVENKLILVGVITAAKGIKGEAVIKSFTEKKADLINLKLVDNQGTQIKLKFVRNNNKEELICRVNNHQTRNEIETLRGTQLFCLRVDLPKLDQDEFYATDLKDKVVVDKKLKHIGFVRNILNYGAGDLIELEFNNGQKELFAFSAKNFPEIKDEYMIFIPPIIAK